MIEKRLFLAAWFLAVVPAAASCAVETDGGDDGGGKGDGWTTTSPERLADIPFYFSIPKASVTAPIDRARYPYPTLWNKSLEGDAVGLRVIAVRQSVGVAARQTARREMAASLAAAGVLKDGDIVLTFRPELAGTMAYPHIQMGTTHAGLVYTSGGAAYNIDSPLDASYVGQFDTSHYAGNGGDDAGTDALHIVRPRKMDDARRAKLRDWITTLKANLARINGERAQVKFQSDYLTPSYVAQGLTTRQTVTLLGKIILEVDTSTRLPMYCSEFAWHMLALSACTADEIRAAPSTGAACVDEPFAAMPLVARQASETGLAEGPLRALLALPSDGRDDLVEEIFADGDPGRLSSGHRAVAEQVAPLMGALSELYGARAAGASVEDTAAAATMLDANIPNNYSPTAFLVHTMGGEPRAVDYVVTIAFVNGATYDKARELARNPVP